MTTISNEPPAPLCEMGPIFISVRLISMVAVASAKASSFKLEFRRSRLCSFMMPFIKCKISRCVETIDFTQRKENGSAHFLVYNRCQLLCNKALVFDCRYCEQ
ncbi:hypothetical protein TNIN_31301 [Trichonephila inaurata madagascariensis]|uniref:Uncharacterized protein n=1 Tax=Trichonephila inaurata madagascariensis TaxID=2747483 RepID=A0A8X7C9J1_9ARAC|nr:hypothetical protein TNIN_31301 [Trichonephila inaurata madagascariensis]